jgi:hypothetical protein
MAPGNADMNNSDYQDLPAISSHWLIAMLDSPAACWRKYLDPRRPAEEPTAALRFGMLVHCLALTPRQLEREFVVADYERRSRAGKARHAALTATGLTVIRPVELEKARALVAALHADAEARKLLRGGKKERTIIQPRARGLLPLKARLDVHQEARRQVVELKTTCSIRAVETALERYRYPLSAAFYQDMSRSLSVIFVFVQSREPFEVLVLPMARPQLQAGRVQWQSALTRFDECWKTNQWSDGKPTAEDDDDPLLLPFLPAATRSPRRFELPVGELAL